MKNGSCKEPASIPKAYFRERYLASKNRFLSLKMRKRHSLLSRLIPNPVRGWFERVHRIVFNYSWGSVHRNPHVHLAKVFQIVLLRVLGEGRDRLTVEFEFLRKLPAPAFNVVVRK